MDYRVVFSPSARRDLRDIVRYISDDAPDRALSFGEFLIHNANQLGQFPEIGREVPEFGRPELREIIVRSYRVIYRVSHAAGSVEVVRFWHAARGTPKTGT
jgi:toxin ParE1/3/4